MSRFPVWDLPTRLFHWLLVLLFVTSWATIEFDNVELHELSGLTLLTLLLFRLLWGFVGSVHSRFSDFFPTPSRLIGYLKSPQWNRPGHNPLGSLSVLAMLSMLSMQIVTGLFGTDEIAFDGPLAHMVSSDMSERMASLHSLSFDLLLALIGLHILSILVYYLRGKNLLKPMFGGMADEVSGAAAPKPVWQATLAYAVAVGVVLGMLNLLG